MEEKELEQLVLTNVDFAKLDKEHVYVFRVKQECINQYAREDLEKLLDHFQKVLNTLDIKSIILAGDAVEITELVK